LIRKTLIANIFNKYMKREIRPIGDLIKTDFKGYLKNNLNEKDIISPWKECVEEVKKSYLKYLSNEIHSIYIRGSVAKGKAIEKISDIDSFAVVKTNPKNIDLLWVKEQRRKIKQKFPFITKVEFEFLYKKDLLEKERYFPSRFTIKLMSVCIYGKDLSKKIDKIKPNLETARKLQEDVEKVIVVTKKDLEHGNKEKILLRCSWAMKRLLRQCMILTMFKEKTFSRDLYPCYKVFSKYYPEKEKEAKNILKLAIYPISNKESIQKILDNFGKWLLFESNKIL